MHSKANIAPCCSLEGFMFLNLNILHDRTRGFVIIQKGWATQQPRRAKNIIQCAEKGRKGVDPHERELLLPPTFPLTDMKTSTHDPKRPAEFIIPKRFTCRYNRGSKSQRFRYTHQETGVYFC